MNIRHASAVLMVLVVISIAVLVVTAKGVIAETARLARHTSELVESRFGTAASPGNIIVNNADSVLNKSITHSQPMADRFTTTGPLVMVEYADSTAPHALTELPTALQILFYSVPELVLVEYADSTFPRTLEHVPSGLQDLLALVSDRVTIEYSDSTYPRTLEHVPGTLQDLLALVSDRVTIEYSDSTNGQALSYPIELMDDIVDPVISNVAASDAGHITWTTDEFATSAVRFGVRTGDHPWTISNTLYTKQHEVILTELTHGTTYFFRVRSTDRSGNVAESPEYSFVARASVYLPVILSDQ